jgi:hypothetical protein
VPLQEKEIIVLDQCAYVIEAIQFEQRLEAIEWWAAAPVSRDYFRLWLTSLSPASSSSSVWGSAVWGSADPARAPSAGHTSRGFPGAQGKASPVRSAPDLASARGRRDGLEVLVYLNRDNGKKYVQALYD